MRLLGSLLLVSTTAVLGQRIHFAPMLAGRVLALDQAATLSEGTPVTITQCRFYVGRFNFHRAGKLIAQDLSYHLIDAGDASSWDVELPFRPSPIDSISFLLGVDSLTNVSGAFGGDLDPLKGMYWTWNSGYINVKLEGTSPVSPYASHAFEIHLGGYLPPYATARRIALPVHGGGPWTINVDVEPLLRAADPRTRCNVMSPGEQAVRLSEAAARMFSSHVAR